MDVSKMIAELRAERDALTAAMSVLENIAQSRGRRRGRPPAWLASMSAGRKVADGADAPDDSRPKRVMSAATKKKMALAQRKRWAAAKKAAAEQPSS